MANKSQNIAIRILVLDLVFCLWSFAIIICLLYMNLPRGGLERPFYCFTLAFIIMVFSIMEHSLSTYSSHVQCKVPALPMVIRA